MEKPILGKTDLHDIYNHHRHQLLGGLKARGKKNYAYNEIFGLIYVQISRNGRDVYECINLLGDDPSSRAFLCSFVRDRIQEVRYEILRVLQQEVHIGLQPRLAEEISRMVRGSFEAAQKEVHENFRTVVILSPEESVQAKSVQNVEGLPAKIVSQLKTRAMLRIDDFVRDLVVEAGTEYNFLERISVNEIEEIVSLFESLMFDLESIVEEVLCGKASIEVHEFNQKLQDCLRRRPSVELKFLSPKAMKLMRVTVLKQLEWVDYENSEPTSSRQIELKEIIQKRLRPDIWSLCDKEYPWSGIEKSTLATMALEVVPGKRKLWKMNRQKLRELTCILNDQFHGGFPVRTPSSVDFALRRSM